MGLCNIARWDKAMKQIEKQNKAHPNAIKHPVCTVDAALQNPEVQKHFMFQRAQINVYSKQAKIPNNKNVGNLTRDVKSLVVPYLFALVGFKPGKKFTFYNNSPSSSSSSSSSSEDSSIFDGMINTKLTTLGDYAKLSANANRYFVNNFVAGFRSNTREHGRRRRVSSFNRQLQYFWIFNKKDILKKAMEQINKNPNEVFELATTCDKSKGNGIDKKKQVFKELFEKYKEDRIKGRVRDECSILHNYKPSDESEENDMEVEGGGSG